MSTLSLLHLDNGTISDAYNIANPIATFYTLSGGPTIMPGGITTYSYTFPTTSTVGKFNTSIRTLPGSDAPSSTSFEIKSQYENSGDWTLDFWFRHSNTIVPSGNGIWFCASKSFSSSSGTEGFDYTGCWCLALFTDGAKLVQCNVANQPLSQPLPANQWTHIAMIREGANLKVYIGGNLAGTFLASNFYAPVGFVNKVAFGPIWGNNVSNQSAALDFDEIRISNVALWTSNFTPPTSPESDPIFTSVSISGNNVGIPGQTFTFTAIPNDAIDPTYLWYKNNISTGVTTTTFSTNSFSNGDIVKVKMTSSSVDYYSNEITLQITPPTINVVGPTGPSIAGHYVSFNTSLSNIPSGATFEWFINGEVLTNTTGTTLVSNGLKPGDEVKYVMTYQGIIIDSNVVTADITIPLSGFKIKDNLGKVWVFPTRTSF